MISVVIPLYNKYNLIAKTLQSVFTQTFTNYEIVIVDDGSTDSSAEVVQAIKDPRIKLIRQKNSGVSVARNRGISEARGEYIAFLDADDEWKPDYLDTINHLTKRFQDAEVFSTRYEFRDEYNNRHDNVINHIPFDDQEGILSNYFDVALSSDPPLWTSAVVVSKSALEEVHGFPVGVTSGEDLITWARLACKFKIAFSKKICACYYTPTTGPTGVVPADLKSINDYVGTNLIKLYEETHMESLKHYIAYWYKMRSVINIRRRNRRASLMCALKSLKYDIFGWKAWILTGLSLSPGFLIKKIMKR